jgi:hypothetical protein
VLNKVMVETTQVQSKKRGRDGSEGSDEDQKMKSSGPRKIVSVKRQLKDKPVPG